jgi:hypothetical protein
MDDEYLDIGETPEVSETGAETAEEASLVGHKFVLSEYLRAKEAEEKNTPEDLTVLVKSAYAQLESERKLFFTGLLGLVILFGLGCFLLYLYRGNLTPSITRYIVFLTASSAALASVCAMSWMAQKKAKRAVSDLWKLPTSGLPLEQMTANDHQATKVLKSSVAEGMSPTEPAKEAKLQLLDILKGRDLAAESDESLLKKHHRQALRHADIQFWAGLLSAIVGFIFIIYMISSLQTTENTKWYEYVTGSLPGAIIAAVSGLFFKQAQETRDRGTDFFKQLNYQKQVIKSVTIAESIKGNALQDQVKAQIALRIIGLDTPNITKENFPEEVEVASND